MMKRLWIIALLSASILACNTSSSEIADTGLNVEPAFCNCSAGEACLVYPTDMFDGEFENDPSECRPAPSTECTETCGNGCEEALYALCPDLYAGTSCTEPQNDLPIQIACVFDESAR